MRISALILAAGASKRFGVDDKLMAPIGGVPIVIRVTAILRQGGVADLTAVVQSETDTVARALAAQSVAIVVNPAPERGMGSSIATGVAALTAHADGILIVPGDMPALAPDLIGRIVAAFMQAGGDKIIVPCLHDGAQRNPVLWPRRHFSTLLALKGDQGAKKVLATFTEDVRTVCVFDPADIADIDTAEDLKTFKSRTET